MAAATWLLVGVTVAVALVAGGLVVAGAARAAFARGHETFRCTLRVRGARRRPGERQGWPRSRTRARWVHDVLVVRRGLLVPRIEVLAVRAPEEAVRRLVGGEVRGLGAEPLCLVLRLDDGRMVEVAAAAPDRTLLVGPFLAAAMRELPDGPAEQRPRQ
ncbi:MAG TPA: hypothetical protein VK894_00615 [Jiangellales bacterium]|nr:hypothetical protein [Jiangellales bacterium]